METEGSGENERRGSLTVRGVIYGGWLQAYRWTDGRFHLGREGEDAWEQRNHLHLVRVGESDYRKSLASEAARRTVREILLAVMNEWAASHLG
jgi:hypothetical protein